MKKQARVELIMMLDSASGKVFMECESLITWFEEEDDPVLKPLAKYAAYCLKGMMNRSINNPSRVMTEEEYKAQQEGIVIQ